MNVPDIKPEIGEMKILILIAGNAEACHTLATFINAAESHCFASGFVE
jgi:hypothetical protein